MHCLVISFSFEFSYFFSLFNVILYIYNRWAQLDIKEEAELRETNELYETLKQQFNSEEKKDDLEHNLIDQFHALDQKQKSEE